MVWFPRDVCGNLDPNFIVLNLTSSPGSSTTAETAKTSKDVIEIHTLWKHMDSNNGGTPKSSIYRWDFPIQTIHFGYSSPMYGNPHIMQCMPFRKCTKDTPKNWNTCRKTRLSNSSRALFLLSNGGSLICSAVCSKQFAGALASSKLSKIHVMPHVKSC